MILKPFDSLPEEFKTESAYKYYKILEKKKLSIAVKRIFDLIVSFIALLILSPVILVIALIIKLDSPGKVIFRQERITTYGKSFYIYKFRTMYEGSEKGSQVTLDNDSRITRSGKVLRKFRLDEFVQLFNILKGEMSFVGTRPEVRRYVEKYSDEMYATLFLPAGVTSLASIKFKDEEKLLSNSGNTDDTYVNEILPLKMQYNLEYVEKFNFFYDIKLMFMTVFAVVKKDAENKPSETEEREIERIR